MSRNLPLITRAELAGAYERTGKVLITLNHRKVYDVTEFLGAHPGGGDLIEEYAGRDVSEIMEDEISHTHSDAAYELLEDDYLRAVLASELEEKELLQDGERELFRVMETGGDDVDSESELTVTTDFSQDYRKNKFLDLNKPLLWQMIFGSFDKEFYLEQVHKPRHYGKGSAPIFGNFMEPLSLTPWWVVPMLWVPLDMYCLYRGFQGLAIWQTTMMYGIGLFVWTFIEYCMHRFLFHLDHYLPNRQWALSLHFLLHGVHHYLPMDPYRLVMPPALLMVLATPFYRLVHALLPFHFAMAGFAGGFMGYVLYDCTHYFLHHVSLPKVLKPVKIHHLDHHYKNYDLGFGVTSSFWDKVFGTEMVDTSKIK
jgi:4-hydroxysphinganine ceramide fatty acyl 2-hydroxylase